MQVYSHSGGQMSSSQVKTTWLCMILPSCCAGITGLVNGISRGHQLHELVKDQSHLLITDLTLEGAVLGHPALEHFPKKELDRFRRIPTKEVSHHLLQRLIRRIVVYILRFHTPKDWASESKNKA